MAPKLAKMIAALTCKVCNGNGWLGGCEVKPFDGHNYAVSQNVECVECGGSGIDKEPGK